ncbi:MAG: FtsX-like permease family protein [Bacteroidales bacterium]|jgi:ABC-type antimicrobial peptide transport system permease subunit|nr:FtsX-like permease family protein [Bacteroidales bacterium]
MTNFKIALRILWRNKSFSLINILGFSIALTLVIIIYLLIINEISFDNYQKQADQKYRIVAETQRANFRSFDISPPYPLHKKLRENVPGILDVTQIYCPSYCNLFTDYKAFTEIGVTFVDSSFFNFFEVRWITGKKTSILDFGKAVITDELAEKLYGDQDPLGKIITINGSLDVEIAGIVESPPENTHLPFKILIGIRHLSEDFVNFNYNSWGAMKSGFSTYLLKSPEVPEKTINRTINQVYQESYNPPNKYETRFFIEGLREIHTSYYGELPGSYTTPKPALWTFGSIGLFILIMATINFVSLSTIQSFKRSKEVGLRKVFGSNRIKLIGQFLIEAFILIILAEVIAVILTEILIPSINSIMGNTIPLSLYGNNNYIIIFLLAILILTGLLSGIYPAYNISSFNPVQSLKTRLSFSTSKKFSLYKAFVIFQFFLAQFFLIGLIILLAQLNYIQKQELGFRTKNIVILEYPETGIHKKLNFKEQVLAFPEVISASCQLAPPLYNSNHTSNFSIPGSTERYFANIKAVDENYREVYQLKLLAGTWLSKSTLKDTVRPTIVNEKFILSIGLEQADDAVGKLFSHSGQTHQIAGVVKDFKLFTAHRENMPVAMFYDESRFFQLGISVHPKAMDNLTDKIENLWKEHFPESAINYNKYSWHLEFSYRTEHVIINLLGGLSFIAIIISLLGFFGLINFIINHKYKEIAIRKTYGATTGKINRLLLFKFNRLIILASIIAAPFAYFLLGMWLRTYAYRITPGITHYLLSTGIILALATISICYQTWRASNINPSTILRYE